MSNDQYPLVTIISPCYNHENYIIQSLDSIKNQTYPNIEHIIIDDFSKDGSVEKIENWIKENEYNCIFIKHSFNRGISFTLNESIQLSQGKYWSPLATDDMMLPERTSTFVDYLESNKNGMVASDCKLIDDWDRPFLLSGSDSFAHHYLANRGIIENGNFGKYENLIEGNYIPSSLMIKKSILNKVGGFDESLKVEDWEMWLRISFLNDIGYIKTPLTYYRHHENNTIKTMNSIMKFDNLKVFLKQRNKAFEKGLRNKYLKLHKKYFHEMGSEFGHFKILKYFVKKSKISDLIFSI